jgi:hypothetical protein
MVMSGTVPVRSGYVIFAIFWDHHVLNFDNNIKSHGHGQLMMSFQSWRMEA